jgi:DNA mismatch repair protein MutS
VNASMRFHSILFPDDSHGVDGPQTPDCLSDLNLDQVLESVTAGREEYDLKPFFYIPLRDVAAVRYRQDISRDLEKSGVLKSIGAFAEEMRTMRKHLAAVEQLRYRYQKESWFLEAVETYCDAVSSLAEELNLLDVTSRGLKAFRGYLTDYAASEPFTSLGAEMLEVRDGLANVRYSVQIKGDRVTVSKYEGEADYTTEVEATFARFKQGAGEGHRIKLPSGRDMNHVEGRVLKLVAQLHPDVFLSLDEYYGRHHDYLDPTIRAFDREVQFYLAYLEHIEAFRSSGLTFCYPIVSDRSKEVSAHGAFDIALANKLVPEGSAVVCNDFYLRDPERIFVITGPNQGGKTTFARMFGQLHHLAGLGYPVPGQDVRLFLPDRLFTHFEREEDVTTLRGKLEDELVRIRDILQQATSSSVVIMNESFTSTTLEDALFLGKEVLSQIADRESLCVYVTFVDELASLGECTVSMVATVDPDDPAVRTYKVARKPADGLAYAAAIAEKYGLTYESLRGRIAG